MNRLNQLNNQAKPQGKKGPTFDVWESLGYDKYLRPDVA